MVKLLPPPRSGVGLKNMGRRLCSKPPNGVHCGNRRPMATRTGASGVRAKPGRARRSPRERGLHSAGGPGDPPVLRALEESRLLVDGAIHSTLERYRVPGRTAGRWMLPWAWSPRGYPSHLHSPRRGWSQGLGFTDSELLLSGLIHSPLSGRSCRKNRCSVPSLSVAKQSEAHEPPRPTPRVGKARAGSPEAEAGWAPLPRIQQQWGQEGPRVPASRVGPGGLNLPFVPLRRGGGHAPSFSRGSAVRGGRCAPGGL